MAETIFCCARAGYHCLAQLQDATSEIKLSAGLFAPGDHVMWIALRLRHKGSIGMEIRVIG